MVGLGNIDDVYRHYLKVIDENQQLKELLKECKEELEYHSELIFCELESDNSKIEFKHLLTRINAALNESEEHSNMLKKTRTILTRQTEMLRENNISLTDK